MSVMREAFYRIPKGFFYSEQKDEAMSRALSRLVGRVFARLFSMIDSNVDEKLHNLSKIEYAARLHYLTEADRRVLAMSSASILYAAAIVSIFIITVNQTIAV